MKRIIPLFFSFFIFPDIDFNFQAPFGIGIDRQGMVYIANAGSGMIKRYSESGRLNLEFGKAGEGEGELEGPRDVAVNSKGDIYIADCWNNRVSVFSPDGTFKMHIGGLGEGFGRFRFPSSLAIDEKDYLYVVDTGNGVVQKFDPSGRFIMEFGRKEGLKLPQGIAIDDDVYISDTSNNRIMRYTRTGEFVSSISGIKAPQGIAFFKKTLYATNADGYIMKFTGTEFIPFIKGISNPYDIAFSPSSLWVAETGRNKILKFSPDGILEASWSSTGSSLERLNLPYDIGCSNADIYIADTGNNRILRLSSSFEPKGVWDFPAPIAIFVDGEEDIYCLSSKENLCIKFDKLGNELLRIENLSLPKDLVVNEKKEIFILLQESVLKFSPDGKLVGTICSFLSNPSCIAFDNFGFILISDEDKIKRFSPSGILVKTIENLKAPAGIVVDKDDNIYVAERGRNAILKLDFYGNILDVIDNPRFLYPYGLTMDKDGALYIADCGNHRIVVLGGKLERLKKVRPSSYLPDLVVSEISVLEPKVNVWTRIQASIKNQGNIKADFISVDFLVNTGKIGFGKIIKSLLPQESTTINTIWLPAKGTNTIKVIIDQENKIKEEDKENNTREKEVFVW